MCYLWETLSCLPSTGNALEVATILKKASERYVQTIIMVTHDRQMAEYADRILHIEDGVITEV